MNRQKKSSVVLRRLRGRAGGTAALVLSLTLGLAACGQKGPLTLPKGPANAASGTSSGSTR